MTSYLQVLVQGEDHQVCGWRHKEAPLDDLGAPQEALNAPDQAVIPALVVHNGGLCHRAHRAPEVYQALVQDQDISVGLHHGPKVQNKLQISFL